MEMLDTFFQSGLLKWLIGEYFNVRKARRMFVQSNNNMEKFYFQYDIVYSLGKDDVAL